MLLQTSQPFVGIDKKYSYRHIYFFLTETWLRKVKCFPQTNDRLDSCYSTAFLALPKEIFKYLESVIVVVLPCGGLAGQLNPINQTQYSYEQSDLYFAHVIRDSLNGLEYD